MIYSPQSPKEDIKSHPIFANLKAKILNPNLLLQIQTPNPALLTQKSKKYLLTIIIKLTDDW